MDEFSETVIPKELIDDFNRVSEKAGRLYDIGLQLLPFNESEKQYGYAQYINKIKQDLEQILPKDPNEYAAYHRIKGSTVDWSRTMDIDTPDRLIERYIDELLIKFQKLESGEITLEQFYEQTNF